MSRFSGNLSAVTWLSTVQTLDVARLWITHLSLCLCNSRAQRKHDGTVAEGAAKLIWSKLSITRYYTMTRDYGIDTIPRSELKKCTVVLLRMRDGRTPTCTLSICTHQIIFLGMIRQAYFIEVSTIIIMPCWQYSHAGT